MATESVDEILFSLHTTGCDKVSAYAPSTPKELIYSRPCTCGVAEAKQRLNAYYTRECARKVLEARLAELEQLKFHGSGNEKQTLAAIYTHYLIRLKELRASIEEVGGGE